MTPQEKAKTTRERNLEAQMAFWDEQRKTLSTARVALTKLMEREDATPAEILQASQLLIDLGKH